jgi:hypothetical protein
MKQSLITQHASRNKTSYPDRIETRSVSKPRITQHDTHKPKAAPWFRGRGSGAHGYAGKHSRAAEPQACIVRDAEPSALLRGLVVGPLLFSILDFGLLTRYQDWMPSLCHSTQSAFRNPHSELDSVHHFAQEGGGVGAFLARALGVAL